MNRISQLIKTTEMLFNELATDPEEIDEMNIPNIIHQHSIQLEVDLNRMTQQEQIPVRQKLYNMISSKILFATVNDRKELRENLIILQQQILL